MPKRITIYLDDEDLSKLEALRKHYSKMNPHLPQKEWNNSNLIGIALAMAVYYEIEKHKEKTE